ncbi:MAG: hypothetical protein JJE35_01785 [Thermoleophilia bacterium]|nr:hypothetical protein [Thermoleophilia bacterium]
MAVVLLAAPVASAGAEDVLTPVIANVIATPEPVLASDGRQHLAYELQLINRSPAEIDVRGIKAVAGAAFPPLPIDEEQPRS